MYRIVHNNGRGHYFFARQKSSQNSVNAVTISGAVSIRFLKKNYKFLKCNLTFSKQTLGPIVDCRASCFFCRCCSNGLKNEKNITPTSTYRNERI